MKKKLFLWVIGLTVALVAIATVITSQIKISEQEKQYEKLEAVRDGLLEENERLEHDLGLDVTDEYIVRMMRKLGYYFPGEKNITFTKTPDTTEEEE